MFSVDSNLVSNCMIACFLGVNALPLLGIHVVRCNGEPILSLVNRESSMPDLDVAAPVPVVVTMCLVKSLPAQKCRVVKVLPHKQP